MFDEFSRQCFQVGFVFAMIVTGLVCLQAPPLIAIVLGFGFSSVLVIPVLLVHYVMMSIRRRRGE